MSTFASDRRTLYRHSLVAHAQKSQDQNEREIIAQLEGQKSFTSIICMNLSEQKLYVYSQNGLLSNRVEYSDLVDKYGEMLATSNSGQSFIFYQKPEVTIFKLSIFGLHPVQKFSLKTEIEELKSQKPATEAIDVDDLLRNDDVSFQVNDEFDVCLLIKLENEPRLLLFRKFNTGMF